MTDPITDRLAALGDGPTTPPAGLERAVTRRRRTTVAAGGAGAALAIVAVVGVAAITQLPDASTPDPLGGIEVDQPASDDLQSVLPVLSGPNVLPLAPRALPAGWSLVGAELADVSGDDSPPMLDLLLRSEERTFITLCSSHVRSDVVAGCGVADPATVIRTEGAVYVALVSSSKGIDSSEIDLSAWISAFGDVAPTGRDIMAYVAPEFVQ